MRSLKKSTMAVGAAVVLTALTLSWTSPAFAEDASAPPSPDTSTSAQITTSPSQESIATQTPAPTTDAPSAPAEETAPTAPEPAPADTNAVPDGTTQPTVVERVSAMTLTSPPSHTTTPKKVFVCKYVGTPNVDERLQTGQNPISVSVNSIKNWDGTLPGYFADAHGRSYVLAYNVGQAEPDVSECPTPVPPVTPVVKCVNSGSLTWTKNADLSEATVTLKQGFTECDVSLNSYETEGATWETSGTQTFVDHATVHLTTKDPTAKLTVKVQGCFQQQDLYIGTTRFDGVDGALPHHPDSTVPKGLIDHWNGAVDCTPPPPTCKVCTTVTDGPTATNKDANGWYQSDTRSTGKVTFVPGGVNLQTTDTATPSSSQNKATLYHAITPTPLSQFGEPSVTFADGGSGVKPGMQVGIDVDGDGDWDGYLVGEPWSYGAHNWWVNKPGFNLPSGMGYTSFGTWADFVAANPNAKVIEFGLSLGSGVVGNWTVTSFTADCINYTFDYVAPVIQPVATISAGACYYNADQDLSFKPIYLTFDNTKSEVAVDFTVSAPYGDLSRTVPAGETVTVRAQDGWQNGVGYEVTANGQTFELNIPAFDSCEPVIPTVTPENVWAHDSCGVSDDSINVPGTLDGTPSVTTDSVTGDVVTRSSYTSSQGVYVVVDTTTKAGVRTAEVTFIPNDGAPVTTPGADDTYTVVTIEGNEYAQWTYTFDSTPCPTPTPVPPTNTTPSGGVNTGLSGSEPGMFSATTDLGTYWGFGGLAVALIAAIALFVTFRPKRSHVIGEAGVEKP